MHRAERARVLDAKAGQLVDVEEAAIIDAGRREPPVGEAVVLPLEQPVQQLDAAVSWSARYADEAALDDVGRAVDSAASRFFNAGACA